MRPFSILETVYAAKAHHHGGERIAGIFELHGEKANDVEGLKQTLRQLQQRHPALRMRMNFDGTLIKWKEDPHMEIPVVVAEGDPFYTYYEQSNAPLKSGEAVARVLLVKGKDENSSTIIPMLEHFTGDGVCFLNFVHEILLGLSGDARFKELVAEHLSYSEASTKLGVKGYDGKFIDKLMSVGRFALNLHKGNSGTKRPKLKPTAEELAQPQITIYESLSPEITKALLKSCKLNGTSLTGLMGAVVAETYAQTIYSANGEKGKESFKIAQNLAFNLRKFYKPPLPAEDISFHAGVGSPIVLSVKGSANVDSGSTWLNAVQYKKEIIKHQKQQLPLAVLLLQSLSPVSELPQPLVNAMASSDQGRSQKDTTVPQDLFLTNWGRIPIDNEYNGLEVLSFIAGVNETTTKHITVVMSTFRGKLCLSALASKKYYTIDFCRDFLNRTIQRLESIAGEE